MLKEKKSYSYIIIADRSSEREMRYDTRYKIVVT